LHQFKAFSEHEIGSIPLEWNHLVGVQLSNTKAKNFHYTDGGPYFKAHCKEPKWWREEFFRANKSAEMDARELVEKLSTAVIHLN
jgi:hypothetical protein